MPCQSVRLHRHGKETLLVVTEPGEIHAVIGEVSTGMGTPQNDSRFPEEAK